MKLSLYKLFFYFRSEIEARKYLMGCLSLIDVNAPCIIQPILSDTIVADSYMTIVDTLKSLKNEDVKARVCINLSIAFLHFYNGKPNKTQKQLKELQHYIDDKNSILLKEFRYLFESFVALLLDSWKYCLIVFMNPLNWLSSKRREECLKTCNYYKKVKKRYDVNNQKDIISEEWSKQIKGCIKVCEEIAKST